MHVLTHVLLIYCYLKYEDNNFNIFEIFQVKMATLSSVRISFSKSLNIMRCVVFGEYGDDFNVGLLISSVCLKKNNLTQKFRAELRRADCHYCTKLYSVL